jgi:hypothetical protein
MNPIRHAVPNVILTARSRTPRLAQAALLFVTVLFGAVSCADGGVTEPLTPVNPLAGLKTQYDSVAPAEEKNAPAPSFSRASLAPSFSASGAGSLTNVASIPFAPEPGPFASQLPGCDDCTFGGMNGLPIGFSFSYYGTSTNNFWISSNGFVSFSRPTHTGCCHGRPLPVFDIVNNMIAVAWTDLNPKPGQMSFEVRGDAPRRRLVINYDRVAVVGEGTRTVTAQLILFEGTNVIELHTTSKPAMTMRATTQGAENAPATEAAFVQGRVANVGFALASDAVRFSGEPVNALPVALPGGNAGIAPNKFYEGVEGVAVEFKGSGVDLDNDQLTYSWDFNNDGVTDAETAEGSFTYADGDGTYSALLTVNDGRGGIGQARVDVQIKNAAPVVTLGNDIQINAGDSASWSGQFSDTGANDAPWGWTYNLGYDGSYFGTTETQSEALTGGHRYCKAGKFPVKLTVVDRDGSSGSDDLWVTVDALPVQIEINPNIINLNGNGHGMISVKIFSRPGLDATALNPNSIKLYGANGRGTQLARTGGGLWHWNAGADLNGDGLLDVSAGFRRDELIANGDLNLTSTELRLGGEVGSCGEVSAKAAVRAKVNAKDKSTAASLQPTGAAAEPIEPTTP